MHLYADEDFPWPVVQELGRLGHDVITAQQDNLAGTPDPSILARAHALRHVLLTHNRRHFQRLHDRGAAHSGIVLITRDDKFAALAARIDSALAGRVPGRWCIRVNRPPKP